MNAAADRIDFLPEDTALQFNQSPPSQVQKKVISGSGAQTIFFDDPLRPVIGIWFYQSSVDDATLRFYSDGTTYFQRVEEGWTKATFADSISISRVRMTLSDSHDPANVQIKYIYPTPYFASASINKTIFQAGDFMTISGVIAPKPGIASGEKVIIRFLDARGNIYDTQTNVQENGTFAFGLDLPSTLDTPGLYIVELQYLDDIREFPFSVDPPILIEPASVQFDLGSTGPDTHTLRISNHGATAIGAFRMLSSYDISPMISSTMGDLGSIPANSESNFTLTFANPSEAYFDSYDGYIFVTSSGVIISRINIHAESNVAAKADEETSLQGTIKSKNRNVQLELESLVTFNVEKEEWYFGQFAIKNVGAVPVNNLTLSISDTINDWVFFSDSEGPEYFGTLPGNSTEMVKLMAKLPSTIPNDRYFGEIAISAEGELEGNVRVVITKEYPTLESASASSTIAPAETLGLNSSLLRISNQPLAVVYYNIISEDVQDNVTQFAVIGNTTLTLNSTETITTNDTGNVTLTFTASGGVILEGQFTITTEDGLENAIVIMTEFLNRGNSPRIGIASFSTDSTGKLAPLDSLVAIVLDKEQPDGSIQVQFFEWKAGPLVDNNQTETAPNNQVDNTSSN